MKTRSISSLTLENERRVVNQDQRLKSIIISCLPDDIMESVINCETTKDTWTDLDKEEVSYDEEETRVQVLMALADDELFMGKNHARNGEWINITMKKVERLYPNSKLPNFNTGRILVPESQAVNECLQLTEKYSDPESSKDSGSEPQTPLPPLKNLQGASLISEVRGGALTESSQSSESSIGMSCTTCGSSVHSTTDYNDFEHFKRGEKLQATKAKEPTKKSMTGVKSYLHKYVVQLGPKVVFGDNSSCITEEYCSINYGGIIFSKVAFVNGLKYNLISISQICDAKYIVRFDDKQGTIFNVNKEIMLRAPRRNDVYAPDMSSLTPNEACFFAKSLESVNWLWHKRMSHLNFKNINKLAKQNKVLGLPSLVYSKDKPCLAYEKNRHKRASFKTKQKFSIKKCLHLLYMDLFGPVSPMPINHEKYTLVIIDEYSRYTWVHFLRKKRHATEMIMSIIRMVENQNDVKVKQIRTDNRNEFRNSEIKSFCDEKGISQNFSSPYTPE
ncbi:retrovirus-related pol polyprotein from transposon TNT 1-94 [Tanacetum coccineum]